jgi:hypothetical protein
MKDRRADGLIAKSSGDSPARECANRDDAVVVDQNCADGRAID